MSHSRNFFGVAQLSSRSSSRATNKISGRTSSLWGGSKVKATISSIVKRYSVLSLMCLLWNCLFLVPSSHVHQMQRFVLHKIACEVLSLWLTLTSEDAWLFLTRIVYWNLLCRDSALFVCDSWEWPRLFFLAIDTDFYWLLILNPSTTGNVLVCFNFDHGAHSSDGVPDGCPYTVKLQCVN